MKAVSDKLKTIAETMSAGYLRSASLDQANGLIRQLSIFETIIIYVGYGASDNKFEGAEPLQSVDVEAYVLVKQSQVDPLTDDSDEQLAITKQLTADIIYQWGGPYYVLEYTTEPVQVFDDLFIGHLLSFTPTLPGDVCSS